MKATRRANRAINSSATKQPWILTQKSAHAIRDEAVPSGPKIAVAHHSDDYRADRINDQVLHRVNNTRPGAGALHIERGPEPIHDELENFPKHSECDGKRHPKEA